MHQEHGGAGASRIGWTVFLALAVLTVVEYVAAVVLDKNVPLLVVFAVLKAALIARYFMHLLALWQRTEEDY